MIREISYKVTENKVEPSTKQWLGMQREDCATVIKFDISKMPNYLSYDWRIDFDQVSAGYNPSVKINPSGNIVSRKLPYDMTRFGGDVQITLVGSKNGEIVYSFPVKGYLTAVSQSEKSDDKTAIDITSAQVNAQNAALSAEKSAKNAAASAENAKESQVLTEEARRALEGGAEFVFVGGNADGKAKNELVVDDEMSEYSKNPVQNKAISKEIKRLKNRRYLLIGDSYGQGARSQLGVTGWAPLFKEKMGLSDNDCIINTLGGTGFCRGVSKSSEGITIDNGVLETKEYKFIDLLSCTATMTETNNKRELKVSEVFPVTNPETITDIVVCGGYNDMSFSNSDIAYAINNFVAKAKELYPNALVSVGMVGCSGEIHQASKTQNLAVNSLAGYAGVLSTSNCAYRYLKNVEYVLKLNPVYMYEKGISDGIHPTAAGYKALANAIVKAVMGGFTAGYASYKANLKDISGVTLGNQPDITVKINNAIAEIHIESCTFIFEEGRTINANELIDLADFDPETSLITGTHHDPLNSIYNRTEFVSVSGHFQSPSSEGGKFTLFTGRAGVIDGRLKLIAHFLKSDNSGWATDVPVSAIQIHQIHITTATNIY